MLPNTNTTPKVWSWVTRLALGSWALVILIVGVRVLLMPRSMTVYPIFAEAARNWWAGVDLYLLVPGLDIYRYSPFVTVLFTPFSWFPDRLGGLVWRLLNGAVYLGAFSWWLRTLLPQATGRTQRAMLFLLIVPLSIGSLNNGQSNPLVLGLLLAGTSAVQLERWNLGSAAVALACLFKVYPIAVGLLLALIHPRRFMGRFLLCLALGLALPFLFQQPNYVAAQYASWWQHLSTEDRTALPLDDWYRDLRLLCSVWGIPLSARLYLAVQLMSAAGIAAVCLAGRRAGWDGRRLLLTLLALACCWMTVLGPAAESSTYILLAPSLAVSVWLAVREREFGFAGIGIFLAYGLFTLIQLAVWFPFRKQIHNLGLHPLAGMLYLSCLLATCLPTLHGRLPSAFRTAKVPS
jgi:Glycosyltransferase family 87